MNPDWAVPVQLGVQLAHASVQQIAHAAGIDLLHIKGPATHPQLLPIEPNGTGRLKRISTDADVLVRPGREDELVGLLQAHGWRVVTTFTDGSAFHHASSLWHEYLGYVDVHRKFPGFGAEASVVFEALWSDRISLEIAHQPCPAPCLTAQRLILILHTARGGRTDDLRLAWHCATEQERREVQNLVARLKAEVAFGVALGDFESGRHAAEYDLWRLYATGAQGDRWAEWGARLRAAPGLRGKLRELGVMLRVSRGHLEMELGHRPSRREMLWAFGRRIQRAVSSLGVRLR